MINENSSANLSPAQLQFLLLSQKQINLAHGSVRSGKTIGTLERFGHAVQKCPDDRIWMIGVTCGSVFDNCVKPFMDYLYPGYCSWNGGNHILNFAGKNIQIIGAKDAGSVKHIHGKTMALVYADEMTLFPDNFLQMLFSRLSLEHSMLIGTMNPSTPLHYMKSEIMDNPKMADHIYTQHFCVKDNPFLPPSYIKMLESMYSGLWYRRYVLGEWVMAEGAIYDSFDLKDHVVPRAPQAAHQYFCGVDVGFANPFAAVVCGHNKEYSPHTWVEKELYWDPKETYRQKTIAEYADDLKKFIEPYGIREVYVDPSALAFKNELTFRGITALDGDNDVQNGISLVSKFFSERELLVCECCRNLIREIVGYSWDPKKVEKGEDAPIKKNDHVVDALRYAIYTKFRDKKHLRAPPQSLPPRNQMNTLGFGDGHGWQSYGGGGGQYSGPRPGGMR